MLITERIFTLRSYRVMLDFDLAELYEVPTKRLNEQVKRNKARFPKEFIFRLNRKEWSMMRSHFATASQVKRNTIQLPYAFTEHGVIMLASILKSGKAIKMSIVIVRAFVQLKKSALQYQQLIREIDQLKNYVGEHDVQLKNIYDALENLLDEKAEAKTWQERERIGFKKQ